VLQAMKASVPQQVTASVRAPKAPPVYRPQALPKVLQLLPAIGQAVGGHAARAPVNLPAHAGAARILPKSRKGQSPVSAIPAHRRVSQPAANRGAVAKLKPAPGPAAQAAQARLSGARIVQRAVELTTFYPAPVAYPAGSYRLMKVGQAGTFQITVARTVRPGGFDISIGVRESDGTNHAGVVRGDVVTATRMAYLNHIDVRPIGSHVSGLGALLVYIFAAHIDNIADDITVTTMSPKAAGFYQAIGFPIKATATAYFNQRRAQANKDESLIADWNAKEKLFNDAMAKPDEAQGLLPGITSPVQTVAHIKATNSGRLNGWRRVA